MAISGSISCTEIKRKYVVNLHLFNADACKLARSRRSSSVSFADSFSPGEAIFYFPIDCLGFLFFPDVATSTVDHRYKAGNTSQDSNHAKNINIQIEEERCNKYACNKRQLPKKTAKTKALTQSHIICNFQ